MVSCALDLFDTLASISLCVCMGLKSFVPFISIFMQCETARLAPLPISVLSPKLEIGETSPFHLYAQGELLRDANSHNRTLLFRSVCV